MSPILILCLRPSSHGGLTRTLTAPNPQQVNNGSNRDFLCSSDWYVHVVSEYQGSTRLTCTVISQQPLPRCFWVIWGRTHTRSARGPDQVNTTGNQDFLCSSDWYLHVVSEYQASTLLTYTVISRQPLPRFFLSLYMGF